MNVLRKRPGTGANLASDDSNAGLSQQSRSLYRRMWPLIAILLYYSGLVPLIRWWQRHAGKHSVIIVGYHRAGGNLRQHIRYLQRHYRIVPLDGALEELYSVPPNGAHKIGGAKENRRTPVVVTFDDGYFDNYSDALALARELRFPFTIFLIPGYVESERRFWWLEGEYLVHHARVNTAVIDGRTYHLENDEERRVLAQAIDTRVRYAQSVAEREAFLASAHAALGVSATESAGAASAENLARPLTWQEVREMASSGWVTVGAHTMHHPVLSYLSDPTEVQYEVSECRTELARQVGHEIDSFAYPIGHLKDFGDRGLAAVQDAGYKWGITAIPGTNTSQADPYALRRTVTDTNEHWCLLAAEVAGIWTLLSPTHLVSVIRRVRSALVVPGTRGKGQKHASRKLHLNAGRYDR